MLRLVLLGIFCALVSASRVQVDKETKSNFGATCDELQTTFRNRIVAFRASLDADEDAVTRGAQARMMMRTYGIIRTLRRARTCTWVVDNDSDDLEEARDIIQILLAGNPCAEAARSELAVGASAETSEIDFNSLHRALTVLTSDTCEVNDLPQQTDDATYDMDALVSEAEEDLQDRILELDEPQGDESAFVQTNTVREFMKRIGVVFLMLALLFACTWTAWFLGLLFTYAIGTLLYTGDSNYFVGTWAILASVATGALGFGKCAYELYNNLLPRLTQ